jgi:hypothetical protein
MRELRQRNWDPSVVALIPFPRLLQLMADKIEWTQKLGDVFVAQQADIMDAVQRLRQQAMAAGNLQTGPQCQCAVTTRANIVTIAPLRRARVYVPVYDPSYVYGPWPYQLYPPVMFPLPVGFAFAPGFFIGYTAAVNVAYYWPLWGWGWFDWGGHSVLVDNRRIGAITGVAAAGFATGVWARNAARGGGVAAAGARSGAGALAARPATASRSAARAPAAAVHGRGARGGGRATHFAGRGFGGHHGFGRAGGFHGGGMHMAALGGGHGGGGHGGGHGR